MKPASLIKAVCRMDAAAEPPWMACFVCLDQACRFHVRIPNLAQNALVAYIPTAFVIG